MEVCRPSVWLGSGSCLDRVWSVRALETPAVPRWRRTEHAARRFGSLPPEATYALGAVAAITLDFPLDVALKRNMAAPTTSPVPRVGATLLAFRLLRDRGFRVVFAGLGVKSCEFGVSYACTGYVSTFFR